MFAYGAGPCERVDLVTGPGNIYVAAAKRLLRGVVGIDSEAGPTEIAILADDSADAAFVAADMVSQAEHDPMAASVLVTDSLELADAVEAELDKQVFATRHTERIRTALGGRQSGIVLVDDILRERAQEREALDPLRRSQRHRLRDDAAHRMAGDVEAVETERIDDRKSVGRHVVDGQPSIAADARAHSPVVERHHGEPVFESIDLRRPPVPDDADALNQENGWSGSGQRVEQRCTRRIDCRHGGSVSDAPAIIRSIIGLRPSQRPFFPFSSQPSSLPLQIVSGAGSVSRK